jgi:hypothetical protein
MGKGKRNKRKRQDERRRRVQSAGAMDAPNLAGAAVHATRHAIALVTAFHASPDDLPALLDELVTDTVSQGLVANALLSRFVAPCCSELAESRGRQVTDVLDQIVADLLVDDAATDNDAWDRAVGTARIYAEILDNARSPEDLAENLADQLGAGLPTVSYLIALVQLAHQAVTARCDSLGEDVASYIREISLPAAEAHGNEIDADDVDEYIVALIDDRLAAEPQLLTRAAQTLNQEANTLDEELADEFEELGGVARLAELAGATWDDLDDDDQRLVVITLLDAVYIDPEGDTIADRLRVTWRF